jgi:hypothetical protein
MKYYLASTASVSASILSFTTTTILPTVLVLHLHERA